VLAQRDVWGYRRSAATGLAPLDLRRHLLPQVQPSHWFSGKGVAAM
jgi:hypothetical protein